MEQHGRARSARKSISSTAGENRPCSFAQPINSIAFFASNLDCSLTNTPVRTDGPNRCTPIVNLTL